MRQADVGLLSSDRVETVALAMLSAFALCATAVPVEAAATPTGWGQAMLLEHSDAGLAYNVRVATNGKGLAIYTWTQFEGTVDAIHARLYDPVFGWGETSVVQTDRSEAGDDSLPVIDEAGNAVVTWTSFGTIQRAWAARYDAAAGWGPAARLDTGVDDVARVRLAMDGAGNVMAVWQQSDGSKNDLWASRYVVGSGWGTAAVIETVDGGATQPWVGSDAAGNAIAVFTQLDAGVRKVTVNRFMVGTGWGAAALLETGTAGNASLPYVAVAPDGRAVAVWTKFDASRSSTWSAFYTPAAGWGTPVLVETDDATDANATGVAVDSAGNAMAVFSRCAAGCAPWVARTSTWGAWAAAATLGTPGATHALSPRIAMDARGDAAVIWPQETGGRWDIWSALFAPAAGWQASKRIETDNRGNATTAWIAMDAAGNAYAGWDDYDGILANAWSNVYRAPVAPDTTLTDRIDALEDRVTEQDLKLQKADNDLEAANDNIVALTGQLATLSVVAAVGIFAGIAGIGMAVLVWKRSPQGAGSKGGETKPGEPPAG